MTLITLNVKEMFEVNNLLDFLIKFNLQQKAKKYYKINDLEDVYDSDKFSSDGEDIENWLIMSDDYYSIDYVEERHCEFWKICKIDKNEVLIK